MGKLQIGEITNRSGAIERLGDDVWGFKKFYAIAMPDTVGPLRTISLASFASELRFKSVSKEAGRLKLFDGHAVNAQQLQTMRILNSSSATLLKELWHSS